MSTKKNIIILGGSYGGVSAAHVVLKHTYPHLPDKESIQVVLVSIASQVTSRPAAPRDIISEKLLDQNKLWVDIPPLFEQYPKGSFQFIKGAATALDHTNRKVTISLVDSGRIEELGYYALVIATGSSTPSPLMSFNHQDEAHLKQVRADFRTALASAKSIIIGGGGPTGVETAGEIGEYFNGWPSSWWSFSSPRQSPKLSITLVTNSDYVLPVLPAKLGARAEDLLSKLGVTIIKKAKVLSVVPETSGSESNVTTPTKVILSDGQELNADIYIAAAGYQANTAFINDPSLLAQDGRIKTNKTLRVAGAGPRVYAIGDCSDYSRQAIHLIQGAVPVLAANIKQDLLADASRPQSNVDREVKEETNLTQMIPIGSRKGIGVVNGFSAPSLMIWALKGRDYWIWTTHNLWSGKQWNKV